MKSSGLCAYLASWMLAPMDPLIPGAGIFWTVYYLVNKQLSDASTSGFTALGIAVAIVLGIIFMTSIPGKFFKIVKRKA